MTIWKPDLSRFKGPRYLAIADAIADEIQTGRITPGFQLPTHRDLAEELGVTVGTITRGYAEAARRGLLRGETGRGTYIAGNTNTDSFLQHSEDLPKNAVDLGMTLPLNYLDPNMATTFHQLAEEPDLQSLLRYYPSKGRHMDREIGAQWLKNYHLNVSADQVQLTNGGQNAIAVVLSSLFRPGDTLAVENVTYPLFKTLARRYSLKLVSVNMDNEGMLPEDLEKVCHNQHVRGIYCMPTCHNPTTACMSQQRRESIAELARKYDFYVIEDEAYALLHEEPFTPIYNLAPERTFYIASLSKAIACGLRYGYLVSPLDCYRRIEQAIADMMWMASPVSGRIARLWIEDGTAMATLHNKRNESRARNGLAQKILKHYPFSSQSTGYFIWLNLPEPWNSTDFALEASEQRVIVTSDEHFIVGRTNRLNAVRIALSGPDRREDVENGLIVIRELLDRGV